MLFLQLIDQPITACTQKSKVFCELHLADHSIGVGNLQADMLIGSDHHCDIEMGRIFKIDGSLTAVHTKLRWVLSGLTSVKNAISCPVKLVTTRA